MSAVVRIQPDRSAGVMPVTDPGAVAAIVKAVVRACEAWSLTNAEAAALFDVPSATWGRMKAGTYKGRLDQDKVTRASLIVGLYKGLRLLFNGPLATGWPATANAGAHFGGKRPVDLMREGGIPAMMRVRQHIDALRGGA
ncbi:MAG: DUF2384 domain-containing protein [Stappia sp.]|uniref:MbcA/ParS/Xre antitoxin family protein n=1 Tax=Stappia sp. TaxID=1870903 RepID=UPI000C8C036D|nr:DUF2384 domain-containing protein [Stappia sp.]